MKIILFLLIIILSTIVSVAHQAVSPIEWAYPYNCCANNDCAVLDYSHYRETPNGYIITIPVGAHPQVITHPYSNFVPYSDERIRPSPDGQMHICLGMYNKKRQTNRLICLFEPVRMF